MEAIVFAFVSYFTWGIGIFFEAIVARRLRWYSLTFWAFLSSFLLLSLYVPFAMGDFVHLTLQTTFLILVLAFFGIFLGTIFYYEALRIGNRALVGTIASSFPAVAVILSIIFLGERVSQQQTWAIMVIFIGLFLSIVDVNLLRSKNLINKSTLFAVITMFAWGTYIAFIKIPVQQVGWFWPNYITFWSFPLIFVFLKVRKLKLEMPTTNRALLPLLVSTILVRIAELSYNFAIGKGLVTQYQHISEPFPAFSLPLLLLFRQV